MPAGTASGSGGQGPAGGETRIASGAGTHAEAAHDRADDGEGLVMGSENEIAALAGQFLEGEFVVDDGDDEIPRALALDHAPHGVDILRRPAPIAPDIQVAER